VSNLELHFLGDLEVVRDGDVVPLPPSKKTRALLAYLALHDRTFRREQLCDLLWEIPDDPRGSLRWSLSKLRRVVDDDDLARIVADRNNVGMTTQGLDIDVLSLRTLAGGDLATNELATLEAQAARYRGAFLEGLELSNFHEFHAWCIAEREALARAQATLLEHLVRRLGDAPERALPHARARVGIAPYDESARADLVGLLVRTGRAEEAEQQVQLGERMLKEAGVASSGVLFTAWRGPPGRRAAPGPEASARPENAAPAAAAEPVQSATAVSPAAAASGALVGREAECGRLRTRFGRVLDAGLRCMLLRGDPGIGKSRLLAWARDMATHGGAVVLTASVYESEALRPYALWLEALRARDVGAAVFGETDRDNRDLLFDRLADYASTLAGTQPVVITFDDVQWADESSMAALHYLARRCRDAAVFVLLAAREGEIQDNAALQQALRGLRQDGLLEELHLGPLPDAAIRELVGQRAPEADGEAISRESGGNPLLAIELARSGGALDGSGSLDALVEERLSRLGVEAAEVLSWAAVLSPHVTTERLVWLTGQDANRVGAALERAERQAMLYPSDHGFRFPHELIARGVYRAIAPARRTLMHQRVAALVEQEAALDIEHAADLAHHALASGDPALGARALVSAGRLCLRFFANDDALVLARHGLQLTAQLSGAEQVCRRIELFDVMLAAAPVYDWEAAATEYAALAEQALDHGELRHARLGYHMSSVVRWEHGHWTGAREESLQAELITRGASDEEHVIGMAETARCLAMLERDLNQADAMVMEARAMAERARITNGALAAADGILRYHANEMDAAEARLREARTLCKSAGDRLGEFQANEYLVMADIERGRFDTARPKAEALLALGTRIREGSEAPFARALVELCAYTRSGHDAGLVDAIEALRVADAKHRLSYVLNRAAEHDLAMSRLAEARDRASEALECARVLERGSEMLIAHGTLHAVAGATADVEAQAAHRAAIEELRSRRVAPWALARAEQNVEEAP